MKNVLLVFGGKSYEHDISVVTASQIYNKTKIQDINLVLFYVSREGDYFIYDGDKFILSDFSKSNFSSQNKKFKHVYFVSGEKNIIFVKSLFGIKEYLRTELAIFACHGGDGENGKLVSVFESAGITTSAGNFDSLAVCMNKFLFKQVMKGLSIPVVRGFKITKNDFDNCNELVLKKIKILGFPIILKSNNGGSSIGLFTANTLEEFEENIKLAFEFDNEVIIEKLLEDTREFNVAVLGTCDKFVISEIDEPIKAHEILSFTDKYLAGAKGKNVKFPSSKSNSMASQARNFPANINKDLEEKIKKLTGKIFKELGLSGVVRIDFLLDKCSDKLYVCEVNSIPGSLAYYFFNGKNILVNDLTLRLIEVAEKNREKLNFFKSDFCTEILKDNSL